MDVEVIKKLVKGQQREHSEMVRRSLLAEGYYRKENDILKKGCRGDNPLHSSDNRIPSNFYNILVNQKASYLFTVPPEFDAGSEAVNKTIKEVLGSRFARVCKELCINASNSVTAWLHYWVDDDGRFKFASIDPKEMIPVYNDDLERELIGALRVYRRLNDDGKVNNIYEYWDSGHCYAYHTEGSDLIDSLKPFYGFTTLPGDMEPGMEDSNVFEHGFGKVPFIPFVNNTEKQDDLNDIKELIDAYDKVYSGFLNDLEDIQEIIFILSGYDGEDLSEFLGKLKKYKTVKIDGDDDGKGGLSTLTIDIPVEAREKMLTMTRKSIFEQGMGIDPDPQNFGNSSGVALSYLYSLLELKAGLVETEFREGFEELVKAICRFKGMKAGDITQSWTRTSVRNEAEMAQIAQQSVGILSQESILRRYYPDIDAEKELEKIGAEAEQQMEVYGRSSVQFGDGPSDGDVKDEEQ